MKKLLFVVIVWGLIAGCTQPAPEVIVVTAAPEVVVVTATPPSTVHDVEPENPILPTSTSTQISVDEYREKMNVVNSMALTILEIFMSDETDTPEECAELAALMQKCWADAAAIVPPPELELYHKYQMEAYDNLAKAFTRASWGNQYEFELYANRAQEYMEKAIAEFELFQATRAGQGG